MRWVYAAALAAVLIWGLEQVAVAPLENGDIYPPYSSLRSDPLGVKAFYESVAALPGIAVERLYKQRTPLEGANETMFILGVDAASFAAVNSEELEQYEKTVANGGRLVIAFLPARPRIGHGDERAIAERWHVQLKYQRGIEPDDSSMPRATSLYFEAGPEWQAMGEHDAIERNFGRGSIALVADSFPLSNEGLREARDAAFLSELAGAGAKLVFDENHFGVEETGSVATLLRKYRLEGAVAVLVLAAALFLWRSASSFLPPRSKRDAEAVAGRDAMDGMTALLVRGIPEKNLLNACFAEWSKSAPRESRAAAVEDQIRVARDPVEAYRAACRVLRKETK
jgi:hypothetical protein